MYLRVNSTGGPNWSSNGLIAAIAHEFGHLVGLGDQYDYWDDPYVCNFDTDPSLMDTVKIVNNKLDPCDHSNLTTADHTRLNTFWNDGEYTHQSYEFPCGGCDESWHVDRAWNDWSIQTWWFWSNSPSGPPYSFFYETHIWDNGSHVAVIPAANITLKSRTYPNNYGLHGKWLMTCARPVLYENSSGTTIYGDYDCADNWMYWP